MNTLDWIAKAREHVEDDPHLAVYMIRDLPETKRADLEDLAWSYHKYGVSWAEAIDLLNMLEAHINS